MKNKFAFAGLFLAVGLISGLLLSLNLDIFSLGQCQAVKQDRKSTRLNSSH